ncbi:glycosyl transferase group 2 family protein [Vibrio variabilis]|uniref:Glycosyl transferase group 2 family protein n=1 Tax=Vibrio variabilis TaxID=990271 RepID=A0ABQ0J622_9VIBR|nr:glycosyl transferase group 2 family protein [Vibrio variabilis]
MKIKEKKRPNASIIIPSCKPSNVIKALTKLKPSPQDEVIVAINNCNFPAAKIELEKFFLEKKLSNVSLIDYKFEDNVKFSFSKICNDAAEHSKHPYLVFFNDDLSFENDSLEKALSYLKYSRIGAVAPMLEWTSGVIQNAGIFGAINRGGLPGLYGRGLLSNTIERLPVASDAVSGACLCIRRELFTQLGGFDEVNFAIAYNDVDLGYRINELGFICYSLNHISALHVEGDTRGSGLGNDCPKEEVSIVKRYSEYIKSRGLLRSLMLIDSESGGAINGSLLAKNHDIGTLPNSVLVVTHNMNLEGATKVALDVVKLLHNYGCQVHVLALSGGELLDDFRKYSYSLKVCGWDIFSVRSKEASVKNWILNNNVELAIANTVISSSLLYSVVKNIDIRQINYIHESEPIHTHLAHFGSYWVDMLAQAISQSFNIFVSKYTVDVYRNFLTSTNWSVLYNYAPKPQDQTTVYCNKIERDFKYTFVTVGTICKRKIRRWFLTQWITSRKRN